MGNEVREGSYLDGRPLLLGRQVNPGLIPGVSSTRFSSGSVTGSWGAAQPD